MSLTDKPSLTNAVCSIAATHSYCGSNIFKVTYKMKYQGMVYEREQYVVGVFSCSDMVTPALAVIASYRGRRIKILKVEFLATGINAMRENPGTQGAGEKEER